MIDHVSIGVRDIAKAKAFYGELFGWQFQDNDMGPMGIYSTFKPDEGPGGGMVAMPGGNPGWLSYVGVKDINQATDQAPDSFLLSPPQQRPFGVLPNPLAGGPQGAQANLTGFCGFPGAPFPSCSWLR